MPKSADRAFKTVLVLLLTLLMSIPAGLIGGSSGDDLEPSTVDVPEAPGTGEELTEEQVLEMGIPMPPMETRSDPWNIWERYSYPQSEEGGAIAYNATSNRVYTYGGGSRRWNQMGGYWSFSGSSDMFYYDIDKSDWISFESLPNPGSRYDMAYAVDDARGIMYLYGGYMDGSMMNDLWQFEMGTEKWTRLNSQVNFQRRAGSPMVFDPNFGTKGALYVHMGRDETTEYDKNITGFFRFDLANPSGTPTSLSDGRSEGLVERSEHDMCIDAERGLIYLFGGKHTIEEGNNYDYLQDLWVYSINDNTWSLIDPYADMDGLSLNGARMFYRPIGNTVNIWGGRQTDGGSSLNITLWTYAAGTDIWSRRDYVSGNSPSGRMFYARYYSTISDLYFVFHGRYLSGQGGRYRDLNYLDMIPKTWMEIPLNYSVSSVNGGIFVHNEAQKRIYYIGPNINSGWGGNGSAYIYYFDLVTKDWRGPIYNSGTTNPASRSNAGLCYIPTTNEVYMYGGGYTQGFNPTQYYNRDDMWKVDLGTFRWTVIYAPAGTGPRQGFQMTYRPADHSIYFYGGYFHPTTSSDRTIYDDFHRFDLTDLTFHQIAFPTTYPGPRYGAAQLHDPDGDLLYLYAGWKQGATNPQEENDIWTYNYTSDTWTEIDAQYKPSARSYAKLTYDPLTREIIMTGGSSSDDLKTFRILEGRWYDYYQVLNPGPMDGHAAIFLPDSRDLWVFGSDRHGVWKYGFPVRLAIQKMRFEDSEGPNGLAYAMYKSYHFSTSIKAVSDTDEIDLVKFAFRHQNGLFTVEYDHALGEWKETDPGDYAILTDRTVSENGLFLDIDLWIKFNWTWVNRPNLVDRTVTVDVSGSGEIAPDRLDVKSFLDVRTKLELRGALSASAAVQGAIANGSWVRAGELVSITGPVVAYLGANVYPPLDSYDLLMWDEDGDTIGSTHDVGEPMNFTFFAPDYTITGYKYVINISGVPDETDTSELGFMLSADKEAPGVPSTVLIHADGPNDERTTYDNDTEVFVTWGASPDPASLVKGYYWSYDDNGGTRDGTPIEVGTSNVRIELPGTGEHRIFIWAEDSVGNIGLSTNSTILIDQGKTTFRIISPDLNEIIPYTQIDLEVNVSDEGGSTIKSQSVKYRFTNNGLSDQDMWLKPAAWKYVTDIWTSFHKPSYQFKVGLKNPPLSDSYDNYIQFEATDGAGTVFTSSIYNIKVNTDLRYPVVSLIGPTNNAEFDNPDKVEMSWNVTFFEPKDVSYKIYISKNRNEVANEFPSALWTTVYNVFSYQPQGLEFGTYHWTIIPIAQERYKGNCTNGIWAFSITNEANYAFTVSSLTEKVKVQQGGTSIIGFRLLNTGQKTMVITPTLELDDGTYEPVSIMRYDWPDLLNDVITLEIQEQRDVNFNVIKVNDNATVGNYTLNFTFTSDWGIIRYEEVTLEITALTEEPEVVSDNDYSLFIAIGIILFVLLIVVIGGLYFFLVKKKSGADDTKDVEAELSELESQYGIADSTGVRTAPQPKGLKSSGTKGKAATGVASGEIDYFEPMEEQEAPKLVDETSEDAWMNLVATETIMEVQKSDTVEEDKAVATDKEKSLKDLLFEMGAEDQ